MVEDGFGGVMGDITYAEVEIVRFMNPKIRTRYQRPKNALMLTPFNDEYLVTAEVEMVYKVSNTGVDTCTCNFNRLYCWGNEAKLMVLRSGRIAARRRQSCHSVDKRHKQRLATMLKNGGIKQKTGAAGDQ